MNCAGVFPFRSKKGEVKMKKFKKLTSMALVAAMAFGTLTGCGSSDPKSDDWVTLRVEMYDRSIAGFNEIGRAHV